MQHPLEDASDEELVSAFAERGDRDALDVLLRRHEARVYGLAYRMLGNRSDALDASQEAFLLLFRKAGSFKGHSAFTTWLYTLTANAARDIGRRRSRSPQPVEQLPERTDDAIEDNAAIERLSVEAALAELPADQRAVLVLRDLYGYSYEEISEIVGTPLGTVKSRIARGRLALGEALGEPAGRRDRLSEQER